MTRVRRTVAAWEPTTQQRHAARLLAACATWEYTAKQVGVRSLQTIANWLSIPEFKALVLAEEANFDQYLESDITGSLAEMFGVWRQFLRGEISASDKRIPVIAPSCIKYIERFYGMAELPGNSASQASATVLVDLGGRRAG